MGHEFCRRFKKKVKKRSMRTTAYDRIWELNRGPQARSKTTESAETIYFMHVVGKASTQKRKHEIY